MSDEDWTLNQAIEFIAYPNPQRAREAPEHISERDWPPSALMLYWPPEVTAAVWGLWHGLEDGVITATERGRPVPPSRWSVDRLKRLAPDEQISLGPFIPEQDEPADAPVTPPEQDRPDASRKPPLVDDTKAKLRRMFPSGLGPRDTHKVLANRLGVSVSTIKRALEGSD